MCFVDSNQQRWALLDSIWRAVFFTLISFMDLTFEFSQFKGPLQQSEKNSLLVWVIKRNQHVTGLVSDQKHSHWLVMSVNAWCQRCQSWEVYLKQLVKEWMRRGKRGKYVKYKFDSVLENRPLTMINIKNRGQRWSQLSGWKRRELEYSIWNPDGKRKP